MIDEKDEIVEYSISPNSGRIKKKIRYRKKRSIFSKKKLKKYFEFGLLILLVVIFIVSFILIIRPGGNEIQRVKYLDRKGNAK